MDLSINPNQKINIHINLLSYKKQKQMSSQKQKNEYRKKIIHRKKIK
jgi:hypothetical protein